MFKKLGLITLSLALTMPAFAQDSNKDCKGIKSLRCGETNPVAVGAAGAMGVGSAVGAAASAIDRSEVIFRNRGEALRGDGIARASEVIDNAKDSDLIVLSIQDKNGRPKIVLSPKKDIQPLFRQVLRENGKVTGIKAIAHNSADAKLIRRLGRNVKIGSVIYVVSLAVLGNELYKSFQENDVAVNEDYIEVESYSNDSSASE